MKKISIIVIFILILVLSLIGCNKKQTKFSIKIVIPAGSTEEYVYSHEEISPLKDTITISSGEGLGDTSIVLKTIDVKEKNAYEPIYLTPGMPIKMDVEKGGWFKVGINMQNPTNEDIIVYVDIQDIEVRIE